MLTVFLGNIKFKVDAVSTLKDKTEVLKILVNERLSEIICSSVTIVERANTRQRKVTLKFKMGID